MESYKPGQKLIGCVYLEWPAVITFLPFVLWNGDSIVVNAKKKNIAENEAWSIIHGGEWGVPQAI